MATKYAGRDWLNQVLSQNGNSKIWKGPLSELGAEVGDLLGELFYGIYHVDNGALSKVDWSSSYFIELAIDQTMATFDFNHLTRFVFLCHDHCIRGQISPRSNRTMTLMFHKRERSGEMNHRHPTLEMALFDYRKQHPLEAANAAS